MRGAFAQLPEFAEAKACVDSAFSAVTYSQKLAVQTLLMNFSPCLAVACVGMAIVSAGCGDRTPNPGQVTTQASSGANSTPVTDKWLGKWIGPEGTYLQIAGANGRYEITIRNLDGPRTFQGRAVGLQVEFERDGAREVIRATNGAETGMKWLSEKTNCLTVRAGEGYCRD